jgi:hypothetical protein
MNAVHTLPPISSYLHLGLRSGLFPKRIPTKTLYATNFICNTIFQLDTGKYQGKLVSSLISQHTVSTAEVIYHRLKWENKQIRWIRTKGALVCSNLQLQCLAWGIGGNNRALQPGQPTPSRESNQIPPNWNRVRYTCSKPARSMNAKCACSIILGS